MVREVRSSKRLQVLTEREIRPSIHKTTAGARGGKKGIQHQQSTKKVIVTRKKSQTKSIPVIKKVINSRGSSSSRRNQSAVTKSPNSKKSPKEGKSKDKMNNKKEKKSLKKITRGNGTTTTTTKKSTKKPRLTKKVLSAYDEETLGIRPIDRGSSWDGNSDSLGSVNSGVLDENLCFLCGVKTTDDDYDKVVLCDCCDGEYHLTCVGLSGLPRISWTCSLCRDERMWFSKLKYEIPNFKIPRKRSQKIEICYSPSRPLELAWQECQEKGFMVVKKVFDYEIMKKLTHGTINKVTSSGRIADTWPGISAVITKKFRESGHNLINRDGRFDLKLPLYVVNELKLPEILEPILCYLRTIMKTTSPPTLRTHNVVFAPVGSKAQSWHADDSLRSRKNVHNYFTILIHLNPIDDKCGGTEIWSNSLKRSDMIRPRPGDAFVFNGSLLHRGQENCGHTHRFFYYASFSCGADTNDAN